ncbi:phosphotransferase enzyme family protein [Metarhizium rileyi]|uniref:Phosphotransferase enzyme family protein n=1 Tax=Metarhizium rileyi (strain RCEF 4871) TaxID=1649241 RepID=A0A162JPF9_METRR|nr:phosphotransferase enzyme family protein [Metarhizium rileyi RCEF 4871]
MSFWNLFVSLRCWIISSISQLWGYLIHLTNASDTARAGDVNPNDEYLALTDDEVAKASDDFVASLLPSKIEALASRYNGDRSCRLTGQARGSYNVCFFVKFDNDDEWTVRIPIEPALYNPWETILSEVATINFVRIKTSIPVAKIHAYGNGEALTASPTATQIFLILDYIPGTPLAKEKLLHAHSTVKANFFRQLLNFLAELWSLELPAIGSLMPSDDASHPIVGDLLTKSSNDARRDLPSFISAKAFMEAQFNLISSYLLAPRHDHPEDEVRYDMFCISRVKDYFTSVINPKFDHGPFVLSHPDLRPSNIIVNDEMEIVGLIDWQFTSTVPRQLCTPPSWVTGHIWSKYAELLLLQFSVALALDKQLPKQLKGEWRDPSSAAFHIAHIIRCPADLNHVFRNLFAKGQGVEELNAAEAKLFRNPKLASEAQQIAERNMQYTEYLKSQARYTEAS